MPNSKYHMTKLLGFFCSYWKFALTNWDCRLLLAGYFWMMGQKSLQLKRYQEMPTYFCQWESRSKIPLKELKVCWFSCGSNFLLLCFVSIFLFDNEKNSFSLKNVFSENTKQQRTMDWTINGLVWSADAKRSTTRTRLSKRFRWVKHLSFWYLWYIDILISVSSFSSIL